MFVSNLRKVGGSVMLALPPAVLDMLALRVGATVGLSVQEGRLIIDPQTRPRYTLDELLAASEYADGQSLDEREWVDAVPQGRELI